MQDIIPFLMEIGISRFDGGMEGEIELPLFGFAIDSSSWQYSRG